MSNESIPVVDFRDWTAGGSRRATFIETLGKGLEAFGFVAITHHGTDPALLSKAYATAQATFALPASVKRQYETPEDGRQRGYTSFGVEHAKDQQAADLKEFWHVGRAEGPTVGLPANQSPAELAEFDSTFQALFDRQEAFAKQLLEAIGTFLELPDGFFEGFVDNGNSVLRIIHYPPLPEHVPAGAVRAAQHEDINLITVLPVSTQTGLELLTREGQWMAVHVPPDVMVVDTGDMMQLLTNGRMPATTHRVVNPSDPELAAKPRYSMPFFLHPHAQANLRALNPEEAPTTAGEYLHKRLVDIGVA